MHQYSAPPASTLWPAAAYGALGFVKVSKSQNLFHETPLPTKTNNMSDKILHYEARSEFCQLSFIFQLEFQKKMLLKFTDLYLCLSFNCHNFIDPEQQK